jgi:hypothetical protein
MKYVSLDIETTGLDRDNCQILEVGAIIEDTKKKLPFDELPKFRRVLYWEEIQGEPFALMLNANLIEILAKVPKAGTPAFDNYMEKNEIIHPGALALELRQWLEVEYKGNDPQTIGRRPDEFDSVIHFNVAGKNYAGFDNPFLEKLPFWKLLLRPRYRVLDPGTLYIDWEKDGVSPAFDECKRRAGIDGTVAHNAIDDAWDVIQMFRKFY